MTDSGARGLGGNSYEAVFAERVDAGGGINKSSCWIPFGEAEAVLRFRLDWHPEITTALNKATRKQARIS
jgi:hypothetical protein